MEEDNGVEPSPATNQRNSFQGCLSTMDSIFQIGSEDFTRLPSHGIYSWRTVGDSNPWPPA
jgi:hypothetical protein